MLWEWYGCPRLEPIYEDMVQAKCVFRGRLIWCQNNKEQLIVDKIAPHQFGSDFGKFWRSTNRLYGRHSLPVSVNGVTDDLDIANIFKEHYTVKSPFGSSHSVLDAKLSRRQVLP